MLRAALRLCGPERRALLALVADPTAFDHLLRQRPQDCKPSPRERRLQFTDEGLQNRSAAAVRAYSTSNSTYGSGRTFDEYPPRHLATTARWDSSRAMCTSSPVWGRPATARPPSGCDWPRLVAAPGSLWSTRPLALRAASGKPAAWPGGLSFLAFYMYRSSRASSRGSSRQSQVRRCCVPYFCSSTDSVH